MYDTFTLQTEPTKWATDMGNLDERVAQSFANELTQPEKQLVAQDVAKALLDDPNRFGRTITNKAFRRQANLPTPTNGGVIDCPGCKAMGHDAKVNIGSLETRHLPYLTKVMAVGQKTPIQLLAIGCQLCNGDDGDADKEHKRVCGKTCCN